MVNLDGVKAFLTEEMDRTGARRTSSVPNMTASAPLTVSGVSGSPSDRCAMPIVQMGMKLW